MSRLTCKEILRRRVSLEPASLMVGWYWKISGLFIISNKQASLVCYGVLMVRGSWQWQHASIYRPRPLVECQHSPTVVGQIHTPEMKLCHTHYVHWQILLLPALHRAVSKLSVSYGIPLTLRDSWISGSPNECCNHTFHPVRSRWWHTGIHTHIFCFIMHSRYLQCYTQPTTAQIRTGRQATHSQQPAVDDPT